MAKGKRNNKRGKSGNGHNTTNDSDANLSNIAHDGSGDMRNHKGFSTGAFGTSDIDGSGLQTEVIIERNEKEQSGHSNVVFSQEIVVPARSRTSSMGADGNEGFLNPNDYISSGLGQTSQSSVRSRTSISNFERAHRMSQLSIQTNQDEFVLVPGSGGHDGHASLRSTRSQVSRQSANVGMNSRDDILTEGDETGGDDLRDDTRDRLGSRASQLSRTSGLEGHEFGAALNIPFDEEPIAPAGFRSRRTSEALNEEWQTEQPKQDRISSHTSLYSNKSNGWSGQQRHVQQEEQGGFVHVPSHHASRTSVNSGRVVDGWNGENGDTAGFEGNPVPVQLSRHASRASVTSHRSPMEMGAFEPNVGYGSRAPSHHASRVNVASHRSAQPEPTTGFVGSQFIPVQGFGSGAPSHHASKTSVYSHKSNFGVASIHEDANVAYGEVGDYVDVPSGGPSRAPSHHASKTSVNMGMNADFDNNEQIFGGGGVSHASRHSLHSGYGNPAPSHHASKMSILSHAGGDAGINEFTSRPTSLHASRASIHSHAPGNAEFGYKVPSHHSSRASVRSNGYENEWDNGHQEHDHHHQELNEGVEGEQRSGTSTRSQLSCMACGEGEERGEEMYDGDGLPQLGDEIEVPPEAIEEWGEDENAMEEEQRMKEENGEWGEEERQMINEADDEWRRSGGVGEYVNEGYGQHRFTLGSTASMASHNGAAAPSVGQRSFHASRMSMRSHVGVDENDDGFGGRLQRDQLGGSSAPIPAVRLSRASLNQPNVDWNYNSMGSLNGGERREEQQPMQTPPSHHASKMSLRSLRNEMTHDPAFTAAVSHTSLRPHNEAPRDRRFSSRSTQDAAEWGETVGEEVFHSGYGDEYDGMMSRGQSHRSLYSTRSSKAGEQTEENLLQAMINRSREPSLGSLGDRPFIPSKDGWKSSAHSVHDDQQRRSRRHSRSSSVHLVGGGIDLRDEVIIPIGVPQPKPRSRSASVASRRSYEGVVFADQPELYSHPDDRFGDKSIDGVPFRRTNEHEKTPQPTSKRGSRVYKQFDSDEEIRALASSASVSRTSVIDNTPPNSVGCTTPKARNSHESYLGTAEISMPSPSPFNQTQFQWDEYEALKEKQARACSATSFLPFSPSSDRAESATQTGETIARAAGQRFALHYGGEEPFSTLSAKPKRQSGASMGLEAGDSAYSIAPPPPSCSPPHEDEAACVLQHHQPMGDLKREQERKEYMRQQQLQQQHYEMYDHGDDGRMGGTRKSSSHSSARFAPLPSYDMSYVQQHEARSMASSSKTVTTSTSTASSSTLKSSHQQLQFHSAASAASSYVDHLRPAQPCMGELNVTGGDAAAARAAPSMERTTSGGYYTPEMEQALFSPSKGTVAQKAAAFQQKEETERIASRPQEYKPVFQQYHQLHLQHPQQPQHQSLQQPLVGRQVPINVLRGDEVVVPVAVYEQPKVVNVEIKRATSSVTSRPMQQSGYVHIERPKMNNSFERNNHPAAAVLNNMLSARAASPNSSRSDEREQTGLMRQPSSVGGTTGGGYIPTQSRVSAYIPPPPPAGVPIAMTSPTSAYQRSIRPLRSEDATFHYEMKHDLGSQQQKMRDDEEISKDEQSVLSRVGAMRADLSPKSEVNVGGRQPMRSREAEKAYSNYHEKKSVGVPAVSITSAPKPFTPPSPYRSVALGQQQQVYGAFRVQQLQQAPMKNPPTQPSGAAMREETEEERRSAAPPPIDHNKYTGSTIRRAIPHRGHIRNLAAAFDTIQTKADREVTVIEPQNSSVLQRRASTAATVSTVGGKRGGEGSMSSVTSSARGFAPASDAARSGELQQMQHGDGQGVRYRVPVQQQTTTTTTGSSTMQQQEYETRMSGYDERSIHEWQAANELQQQRQLQHVQQRETKEEEEEQQWMHRRSEEELYVDSESDRPTSIHSGGVPRGIMPPHMLRTSTPLAGVKNDPRSLARALERIPSIRGDDTIGRGRSENRGGVGVRNGGVRALASRFEKAAEEETERARAASMTPRLRRKQESRRMEGEESEDRREAAARRLSRGVGGMERLEREREKRRSQSAHVGLRKRRSSSTSDSGEESVMRDMEAVEKMAREEILRREREEMRMRKEKKMEKNDGVRRQSEEERKIDEMFHGLSSHESVGDRGTVASSRGTISGAESLGVERREMIQQQHMQHVQQSYHYQQHHERHEQHHHYQTQQTHVQPLGHLQQSSLPPMSSLPSQLAPPVSSHHSTALPPQSLQQEGKTANGNYLAAHLHPIGANGELEHGVMRRESTQTMHTTNTQSSAATGLVYSPSVYRETGRALRGGDVSSLHNGTALQLPVENGGRAATIGGGVTQFTNPMVLTTASSPHFSPVNIRGPETAGQRVATYESRDGKNPVRVPSRQVRPYALATSTPMGTVHTSARGINGIMAEDGTVIPPETVEDDSFLSTISNESRASTLGGLRSPANQAEYKKQISRLTTIQSMEEEKISITSKALAHARKKQNPTNELHAQRTILLARLRVAALKRELQRLNALAIVRNPPPPVSKNVLGAMDISNITLHLNRNLCARPTDGGSCSFGFIVVLKCGVEVETTAPVCIMVGQRPAGLKVVHFPEHLRFSNLPVDFTIRLEVYVMKLREPKEESCTSAFALKARNLLVPGTRRAAITAGPGGSSGSGGSPSASSGELPVGELVRCGHTALDRDSVGSMRLYLDAPEYPLEGTIELASRCSRLPSSVEIDLRGFLTMYKVVGGYGSWVRYWAVLRRGVINFWKYPDDEQLDRGGPVASADLSKCTDGEIVCASREICTRQFAFSIDMLVATTPSIVEKKRVLLAADTREQLKAWLAALNETLSAIRA